MKPEFYLARTENVEDVKAILLHPSQFPLLAQYRDEPFFSDLVKSCWCVAALKPECRHVLSLFILDPVCESIAKVHISILPECWGPRGLRMSKAFLEWTWARTKFRKLIGHIDSGNRLAIRFAERAGMRHVGVIAMGLEKNGTKRDLTVMEIDKC